MVVQTDRDVEEAASLYSEQCFAGTDVKVPEQLPPARAPDVPRRIFICYSNTGGGSQGTRPLRSHNSSRYRSHEDSLCGRRFDRWGCAWRSHRGIPIRSEHQEVVGLGAAHL